MALYWPDERVVVTCGPSERAWPSDVLLVTMTAEQAEDPEFVETVRDIVMGRALTRRDELLAELLDRGAELPVPERDSARDEGASPEARAERALMEALLDDDPAAGPLDGLPDEELGPLGGICVGEAGLGCQIVVHHCDTMLVRR